MVVWSFIKKHAVLILVSAIAVTYVLYAIALMKGVNGITFGVAVAVIAGLAGLEAKIVGWGFIKRHTATILVIAATLTCILYLIALLKDVGGIAVGIAVAVTAGLGGLTAKMVRDRRRQRPH
jgi:hypothetical protein